MLDRALVAALVVFAGALVPTRAHGATGKVTAKVTGGKLKITGTAHDEGIQVDGDGLPPGKLRLFPLEGTTVNGSPTPIFVTGVTGDVKFDLGGGSDEGALYSTSIGGKVVMDGGAGDDFLWVSDVTTTEGVKFECGAGDDAVAVGGPVGMTIGGALKIDGGSGTLDVSISGNAIEIHGDAVIKSGSKHDAVDFFGTHVVGNVKFLLGPGDASVDFEGCSVDGSVLYAGSPDDEDAVDFTSVTVGGAIELLAEDGDNDFRVRNCTAGGGLTYNVGAPGRNGDEVDLTGTEVTGATRVELGKGANRVDAGNAHFDDLHLIAKQKSDIVELFNVTCDAAAEILLAGGANRVMLTDSTLHASLTIHTGSGDDVIDTTGTTVAGSTDIDAGGGTNTITP